MLKSISTTYETSLDELKKMYAKELGVEVSRVSIEGKFTEKGDERFGPTWKVLSGIIVKVTN